MLHASLLSYFLVSLAVMLFQLAVNVRHFGCQSDWCNASCAKVLLYTAAVGCTACVWLLPSAELLLLLLVQVNNNSGVNGRCP